MTSTDIAASRTARGMDTETLQSLVLMPPAVQLRALKVLARRDATGERSTLVESWQVLKCERCARTWYRQPKRGRKPKRCEACR